MCQLCRCVRPIFTPLFFIITARDGNIQATRRTDSEKIPTILPGLLPGKNNPKPHEHTKNEQAIFRPHAGIRQMRSAP